MEDNTQQDQTIEISGKLDGETIQIGNITLPKLKIDGDSIIVPIKIETLQAMPYTFNVNLKWDIQYIKNLLQEYEQQ